MTPRQFAALCDRLGDEQARHDRRAALVACLIANGSRDRRKRPEPFKVEDFMPRRRDAEQSPEQQAAILRLFAATTKANGRTG